MTAREHNHDVKFIFWFFGQELLWIRDKDDFCIDETTAKDATASNDEWPSMEVWSAMLISRYQKAFG